MSVFFYKSRQKWAVNYTVDGRQKRKLFATEQEALSFDAQFKEEQNEESRYSLGELAIKYFAAKENFNRDTKTIITYFLAGYEAIDGTHIEGAGEFLRDRYADSLNRKDLDRMRSNIKAKTNATNITLNKYQAYIRAILQWAVEEEYLLLNPWRDLKKLPETKKIFKTSMQDFQKIINCSPPWFQWACATAYACSLRPGIVELFSLTWGAFNFEQGFVIIYQGKTGRPKKVYPPPAYLEKAYERFLEDTKNGVPWVCHRNGSKVLSYKGTWNKAVKLAGLEGKGIVFYHIRHISATTMLERGVDVATVAAQLGHSTPATTMNFYAHTTEANQRRAAAALPEIIDLTPNDYEIEEV